MSDLLRRKLKRGLRQGLWRRRLFAPNANLGDDRPTGYRLQLAFEPLTLRSKPRTHRKHVVASRLRLGQLTLLLGE